MAHRLVRRSLILPLLAVTCAGCGSAGTVSGPPRAVFHDTCGRCHTLAAADTHGRVGPNLDELRPGAARVLRAIATGPSVMPSDLLRGPEARRVAEYVATHAGHR